MYPTPMWSVLHCVHIILLYYNYQGYCNSDAHVGTMLHNSYYQWVPVFFIVQAILFYIPRCIWLSTEGGMMAFLVNGCTGRICEARWWWWCWSQAGFMFRSGGGESIREAELTAEELLWAHPQQVQQVRRLLLLLRASQRHHLSQPGQWTRRLSGALSLVEIVDILWSHWLNLTIISGFHARKGSIIGALMP